MKLEIPRIPDITQGKYAHLALEAIRNYQLFNLALVRLLDSFDNTSQASIDEIEVDLDFHDYIDRYNAQKEVYEILMRQFEGKTIKSSYNGIFLNLEVAE